MGNFIRLGDTVEVDFIDVGMSYSQRVKSLAVVTSIQPLKVKPIGYSYDRLVSWSEINRVPPEPKVADVEPEIPYYPHRGDDVAEWLKRYRDRFFLDGERWRAVDQLLERYRECSDYGLTLKPEDDDKGDL